MICTFGDNADVEWWKQNPQPIRQLIGRTGRLLPIDFNQAPFASDNPAKANEIYQQHLAGKTVKAAKAAMVALLEDPAYSHDAQPALRGPLEKTVRPVKFYEKGERPIEILSTRQWFVKILDFKEQLLAQGSKITWHPTHMQSRYQHWVEGLNQDWCISRQRYFGVPFPVWYPLNDQGEPCYDKPLFARLEQLPIDPTSDCPDGYSPEQRDQPGGFSADPDVMDTWATSSLTPQISSHWGIDASRHDSLFPADIRPQSHEIIRTWAFYTITKAWHHEAKVPWHHIAISGWILDPDRKKMSKSVGNVVTPEQYLDKYSADAVRYWTARARLGVDTAFDENIFAIGRKLANKLFNAAKFILTQVEASETPLTGAAVKITAPLDRIWFKQMVDLVAKATESHNNFDYAGALQLTEDRFWSFCDYYLELVKSRAYQSTGAEQASALETLQLSLKIFLQLFAPVMPYITEEIWAWLHEEAGYKSIHSQGQWPDARRLEEQIQAWPQLPEHGYDLAANLTSQIRAHKTEQQKSLKWPVNSINIHCADNERQALEVVWPDIAAAAQLITDQVVYTPAADGLHIEVSLAPEAEA